MRDILPSGLVDIMRDRYLAGVADAQAKFRYSRSDEDSLTGALGQAISTPGPMGFQIGSQKYEWQITYWKIRGRGPGAPERSLGADGIFEIEVKDELGNVLRQKGLPFQAMKEWSKASSDLLDQTKKMLSTAGQGIIVDFSQDKYSGIPCEQVLEVGGSASALRSSTASRDLGHILADDFLDCSIGRQNLRYNERTGVYAIESGQPLRIEHRIVTEVLKLNS